MSINITVAFAPKIEPAPARFVCKVCCDQMKMQVCDNDCCVITSCDRHPSILIQDGKVVGTSA